MADIEFGLPIRTVEDTHNRVQVKICDETTPGQQVTVDSDKNLHAEIHANIETTGTDTILLTDANSNLRVKLYGKEGANNLPLIVDATGKLRVVVDDTTPGTPINTYDTGVGIAKNGTKSINHTTTALYTFFLQQVVCSASGRLKVEIKTGAVALEVTKWVAFNSVANPTIVVDCKDFPVVAGQNTLVVITNLDPAQDVYGTISGYEVLN